MPIAIEQQAGVTRVRLSGRIDVAGAQEIDLPLATVGSHKAVVIDLSAVDFLASMGLRSLVVTGKSIISKKGRVVLMAPRPAVEDVLRTSGVDDLLPIHEREQDAIAAVTR